MRAAALLPLALAACVGTFEEESYYDLPPVEPPRVARVAETLEIRPFDAAGLLDVERALLYRDPVEPRRLRPHPTALWAASPPELIRGVVSRCVSGSGLFDATLGADEPVYARLRLFATVAALEAAPVPPEEAEARIALDVTLVDEAAERVLLARRLAASASAASATPADVVDAVSRAADALCADLVAALAEALGEGR